MPDPTVRCPNCDADFPLTESLAAPLLRAAKAEYERQLAEQRRQAAEHEAELRTREESLERSREALDEEIDARVKAQREGIRVEEERKAKLAASSEVEAKARELTELQGTLKQRESKIAELQRAEIELRRKQRELDDARADLDLTVEKRIEQERGAIEAKARERFEADARRQQRELTDQLEAKGQALADAEATAKRQATALAAAKQAESELRQKQGELEEQKRQMEASVEEQVAAALAAKLQVERATIAEQEKKKAEAAATAALADKGREIADMRETMQRQEAKLAEAQKVEAELLRKQRELDDQKREMELTIEKRVQQDLGSVEAKARRLAEESLSLKISEKEETITSMQRKIEELKQKAEQGSQQLQGEVLEMELEDILRRAFPLDQFEAVPKGVHGGDVLQRVRSDYGQICGTILWESKRTKAWADAWLPKLRDDGRSAKADALALVTATLPATVSTFANVEGVWVTGRECLLGVAAALRAAVVQVADVKQAVDGQHGKMELVYHYLTGAEFRQRIEGIVESFTAMQEDLASEKRAMTRIWAKREKQLERAALSALGMHGDLAGIVGAALPELDRLALGASDPQEAVFDDFMSEN